jgi:thiol:disulfide interchange protein DsbD
MRLILLVLLFFTSQVFSNQAFGNQSAETSELKVSIITECDKLPANGRFSAGILFELQPEWHLYWVNPGDAGLAPKIEWQLPDNISVSDIQWAFPHHMDTDGISSLGYSEQLLLPVFMQTSSAQNKINLTAEVQWLVCKDICIPGKANLTQTFDTAEACQLNSHKKLFTEWQSNIPIPMSILDGTASVIDKKFQLELYLQQPIFRNAKQVDVFIQNTKVVSYQATHTQRWKHNWIKWTHELNDVYTTMPSLINAVIVVDNKQSYSIQLSTQEKSL